MGNRWGNSGNSVRLCFWAPKSLQMVIAAMKLRCLLLRRNAMTDWDRALKNRDISLLTKVCIVRAMVFPVVMYTCESWTIKKAEHWRIDAFELWCWRRLLRVPWTKGDPTSPFWRRAALGFLWKEWYWSWNSSTLATSCEELTHWKSNPLQCSCLENAMDRGAWRATDYRISDLDMTEMTQHTSQHTRMYISYHTI